MNYLAIPIVVFALTVLSAVYSLRRRARRGSDAGPEVPFPKDPFALAWTQGGVPRLIDVAAYDLLRQGSLRGVAQDGAWLLALTAQHPPLDDLDALRTQLLLSCEAPRTAASLRADPAVHAAARCVGAELHTALAAAGLVPAADLVRQRTVVCGFGVALLAVTSLFGFIAGAGAYPNHDALAVISLLTLMFGTGVGLALCAPVPVTEAGERWLELAARDAAKLRLRLLYEPGYPADFMRLRALFGTSVSLGLAEEGTAAPLRLPPPRAA